MFDVNNLDFGSPDEGQGGSEQVREGARQGAGAQAQDQAQAAAAKRAEQRARRRDDGIAQAILQFLTDDQRTHLSVLIARLVERNCPSSFILAILSLINEQCLQALAEALADAREQGLSTDLREKSAALVESGQLSKQSAVSLVDWIERLQMTLGGDHEAILMALRSDDQSLDGTVLQLTTFVLQEHFTASHHEVPFEKIQALAGGILQMTFEPYF